MNSGVFGAEDGFCAEIDAEGRMVAIEAGDAGQLDEELLGIVRDMIAARIEHAAFVWAPAGARVPRLFSIAGHQRGGNLAPSAVVTAVPCGELPFDLTMRELDIITLVAVGLSNAAIAERLSLSTRTVTTHVEHIMQKLGAASRTAAAAAALDGGLVKLPFPGEMGDFSVLALGRALTRRQAGTASRPRPVKRPLLIGAALPLSGHAAEDGEEMVNASQLAIDEINARGGIDGRRVELAVADVDIFDVDSVRAAFTQMADQEADAITSGYLAHQDLAHEVIADAGGIYLHAATLAAMERRVSQDPGRYGRIFQVCPSDSHYGPRFVQFMEELRVSGQWVPSSRRLVIIQSGWDLTDLGLAEAAALADRLGWQLEVMRPAGDSKLAWSAMAERIRSLEPGAVMIGHYLVDGTVGFLDAFLAEPSDTLVYSLYAPSVPKFYERMGDRAEGLVWATVTGTYSDPLARAFATQYANTFGRLPGRSHAGIAYDRVQLIAQAWRLAENPRDRDAVTKELRRIVYRGVNGAYYFGDTSQTAQTYAGTGSDPSLSLAHLIFQIQRGQQRILSPHPYTDGDFVPQSWLTRSRTRGRAA